MMQHCPMQRRTLLRLGWGGVVLLTLAGGGLALLRAAWRDGWRELTSSQRWQLPGYPGQRPLS